MTHLTQSWWTPASLFAGKKNLKKNYCTDRRSAAMQLGKLCGVARCCDRPVYGQALRSWATCMAQHHCQSPMYKSI
jgi:hypothetical protein